VLFDDDSYDVIERAAVGNVVVSARVDHARLGFIAPSASYAPDVSLPYRNAHFVALSSSRIERVVSIDSETRVEPLPQPQRPVPPFVSEAEPAFSLGDLPGPMARAYRIDRRTSPDHSLTKNGSTARREAARFAVVRRRRLECSVVLGRRRLSTAKARGVEAAVEQGRSSPDLGSTMPSFLLARGEVACEGGG